MIRCRQQRIFFTNSEITTTVGFLATALEKLPFTAQLAGYVSTIFGFLSDESDWKPALAKVISDKMDMGFVITTARMMRGELEVIQDAFTTPESEFLGRKKLLRKLMIFDLKLDLKRLMKNFEQSQSVFRRYPLISAPLLIQ